MSVLPPPVLINWGPGRAGERRRREKAKHPSPSPQNIPQMDRVSITPDITNDVSPIQRGRSPVVATDKPRSRTPSLAETTTAVVTLKRAMRRHSNFLSASQELRIAELSLNPSSEQEASSSYRLAFNDSEYLLGESTRPWRLGLEYAKPEEILTKYAIENTIVVFGSARIRERSVLLKQMAEADSILSKDANNSAAKVQKKTAESLLPLSKYYEEARTLGQIVGSLSSKDNGLYIATGGGPGCMEGANRGANDRGAQSIGLNIVLPHEQHPNAYITPKFCFMFHYFAIRKMHLLNRAKALIVCPGGFGSMDELVRSLAAY
jgi:predicted Rossmann-fold nucleotide-binding protein